MQLPKWLAKGGREGKAAARFRLGAFRFLSLLENVRALEGLVEDGREKIRGEYILDRHYVTTLADRLLEEAQRIAFDACLLAPQGGEALFEEFDGRKAAVRAILAAGAAPPRGGASPGEGGSGPATEPEYRLLEEVLEWAAGGGAPAEPPSLLDFAGRAMDHAMAAAEKEEEERPAAFAHTLRLGPPGALNILEVVGLWDGVMEAEGRDVSLGEVSCRPLGAMSLGAGRDGEEPPPGGPGKREWIAGVSEEHLSLRSAGGGVGRLRVEASLTGGVASSFLFFYIRGPSPPGPETLLPPEFRREKTGLGTMAWCYDVPAARLEENLARLGAILFGGRTDRDGAPLDDGKNGK